MVPPVTRKVTAGRVVLPSLHWPLTVYCWVPPGLSAADSGVSCKPSKLAEVGATRLLLAESSTVPQPQAATIRNSPAVCAAGHRELTARGSWSRRNGTINGVVPSGRGPELL